ncbi:hypothetical protein FRB94_012472 [Tulasnella sp. JGI-2019a]|nr:hypothetical protein FRB93_010318 [Tulasnella sp. JGI-2019a]KAG8991479.1 hypothetical protein FRB94_012472 [Tulasnella sp. JGI-2019a]KAG9023506.1 hypothetical protein FRB95_012990 [Tulasnella sp. JGI-2019a]
MRVKTLEIRWHNGDPIYACDFQPLPQSQLKKLISPRVAGHKDQPGAAPVSAGAPVTAYGAGQSFRFATGGSDNNVRVWMVYPNILPPATAAATATSSSTQSRPTPHPPRVEYLATLVKHAGAVNVVRFSPNGEYLASAGDDGMIIIWTPTDRPVHVFGSDAEEAQYEKEHWKPKIVLRCTSREVYDLAWSPNGEWIVAGSTDNTARIYNATDGTCVREIAEHNHYVQGVAWDPLNEYLASQSSDRAVHVYGINTKRGSFDVHAVGRNSRMSLRHSRTPSAQTPGRPSRARRGSASASEAESDVTSASELKKDQLAAYLAANAAASAPIITSSTAATPSGSTLPLQATPSGGAIIPPAPPTPTMSIISTPSVAMFPPQNRPASRRSSPSFSGSAAPSPAHSARQMGRSPSPMPPLPAIRAPTAVTASWTSFKMYGDENYTNFFRRLTFSPDGAFLLTPAGQFEDPTFSSSASASRSASKQGAPAPDDPPVRPKKGSSSKTGEPSSGTKSSVYIYSRANFSRAPIAHLPGHQKASVAVRFSPLLYELRPGVIGGEGEHPELKRIAIERGRDQTVELDLGGASTTPSALSEPIVPSSTGESNTNSSHGHTIHRPPSAALSVVSSVGGAPMTTPERPIYAPAPQLPSASPSLLFEGNLDRRVASPAPTPSLPVPAATGSVFALPYRMLFAVATQDSVMVYDTQQAGPVCMFSNLHYSSFTDMAWAPDGQSLMLASSDGYCSIVVFDEILPLYHNQQYNLQLQSIVQQHTVSPTHAREHSAHGGHGHRSGSVAPHSPAFSTTSLVRGSTPSLTSAAIAISGSIGGANEASSSGPRKRAERSDSTSTTSGLPALGLQDMGTVKPGVRSSSSSSGIVPTASSVTVEDSPREASDAPPPTKKRRVALKHHGDADP